VGGQRATVRVNDYKEAAHSPSLALTANRVVLTWLKVQVTRVGEQDAQVQRLPAAFVQPVTFARRQAQVWDLEW
jgi:hypothetical protein